MQTIASHLKWSPSASWLSLLVLVPMLAILTACSASAAKDVRPVHRETVYLQFASPGQTEHALLQQVDVPQAAQDQCCLRFEPGRKVLGGVLAPVIVAWVATKFISSVRKDITEEIAKYSSTYQNEIRYEAFYSARRWNHISGPSALGEGDQFQSCFVAASISCEQSRVADGICPEGTQPDIVIFGEYLRTQEALRVRPLGYYVSRLSTKRARRATVSFAVRVRMESVWGDGGVGRAQQAFDTSLMGAELAMDSSAKDPQPTPPISESFKLQDWSAMPALPLPSRSSVESAGVVGTVVTIGETAPPPAVLTALNDFLAFGAADLSAVLKDALLEQID